MKRASVCSTSLYTHAACCAAHAAAPVPGAHSSHASFSSGRDGTAAHATVELPLTPVLLSAPIAIASEQLGSMHSSRLPYAYTSPVGRQRLSTSCVRIV